MTYNCAGLYPDRIAFIQDFIHNTACDIIFLQAMWLHESHFTIVKKIDHELLSHNVSGIKNDNIMRRGHGHGGVSTLWRKIFAHKVKPILCECNRLACITLDINDNYKILIIKGFMPNDNYRVNDVDAEFDEAVDYIEQMYTKMANDVNDIILVGELKT